MEHESKQIQINIRSATEVSYTAHDISILLSLLLLFVEKQIQHSSGQPAKKQLFLCKLTAGDFHIIKLIQHHRGETGL